MKQRILSTGALALALVMPAISVPQDLGSIAQQATGNMGSLFGLTQKLHLSPQQLQRVMPILQGEVPKLQSIMGNGQLTPTQKTAETKAVQQKSDSKLKSILSPQQMLGLKDFRGQQLQGLLHGVIPQ